MLKRNQDNEVEGSSLLPLPNPYIVPGGRFREIYYWDSYFTMLGLKESGEIKTIRDMVNNFAYLMRLTDIFPPGTEPITWADPSRHSFPAWWNCWQVSRGTVFTSITYRLWKWNMHSGWMGPIS